MDDMLTESLAGFDAVWQRVTGRGPTAAGPGPEGAVSLEDALLRLIHEETCAAAQASALARQFQADGRALLLRHAADARRHLRRLRAEYYIITGVGGAAGQDCRLPAGKLASLRTALLQAGSMAALYDRAAAEADSDELRQALGVFAQDERRRAREIRALLVDSF